MKTDLQLLLESGLITPALLEHGTVLLRDILKPNVRSGLVQPVICPDYDGLALYWAAQEMSVTVCTYPDEENWWAVNKVQEITFQGNGRRLPTDELHEIIVKFSESVEARRRSLYGSVFPRSTT